MLKKQIDMTYIIQELATIKQRELDFSTAIEPGDWVSDINEDMFIYPKVHWLNHITYNTQLTQGHLNRYLDHFTPENMQVVISSAHATTKIDSCTALAK